MQFVKEETNGETKKVDETRRQECIGEIMRIQRKGEGIASRKGSVGNVNPPLKIETDELMKNRRKKKGYLNVIVKPFSSGDMHSFRGLRTQAPYFSL